MRKALVAAILIAIAPHLRAEDRPPAFYIEAISVTGASRGAAGVVRAESRLREGQTYDENALRDAIHRIQRLPFVISTSFRLGKGTSVDKYVLIISVRQMKPFFALVDSTTHWEDERRRPPATGFVLGQSRQEQFLFGARTFLGPKGMLNAAIERVSDRNDRYTLGFSQYDLFGTHASITAIASYLQSPVPLAPREPLARIDWHHRDNITWEVIAVVPFTATDSLRGSWQRSEQPVRYFAPASDGQFHFVLRSLPDIRRDLFWLHDSTDDPLFPTSGTRITAGVTRSSLPTSSFAAVGRVNFDEHAASAERTWSLTPAQATTWGGGRSTNNRGALTDRLFGRYSLDLWGRERSLRNGDLHLEIVVDRQWTTLHGNSLSIDSTASAGLVYRGVWGVARLSAEYERSARRR